MNIVYDSIVTIFLGDSTVDFLYYFAVESNGTHPGLARVDGSPIAGELIGFGWLALSA